MVFTREKFKELWEANSAGSGITFDDWKDWFRHYDHTKPLAIIHFTKFRY